MGARSSGSRRGRGASPGRLVALGLAVALASCGGSNVPAQGSGGLTGAGSAPASGQAQAIAPSSLDPNDPAVLAYGYPATRDPSVSYQPGVVFVGGGPAAIRGVSANGLTWTIDGTAPGAADLKVGSIMLATARAMGRVAAVADDGGSRVVTLLPVNLTDIFHDAHFAFDTQLQASSLASEATPLLPEALTTPPPATAAPSGGALVPTIPVGGASGLLAGVAPAGPDAAGAAVAVQREVVAVPPVLLAAAQASPGASPTPGPAKSCLEAGVSNWYVAPCYQAGALTIQVTHRTGPLKFGGTLTLRMSTISAHVDLEISGGSVSSMTVSISGIDGISIDLGAGAATPRDNASVRIEAPLDMYLPLEPMTGFPFVFYLEFKVAVDTVFSSNNGTLTASGQYDLSGPIGVQDGAVQAPTLAVRKSILESISGITLAPSAVTTAVRVKFMFGGGLSGFATGPFGSLTFASSVAQGSVLGAPLVMCRTASLAMYVGGGVGLELDLHRLLPILPPDFNSTLASGSLSLEREVNTQVLSRTQTTPDSGACHG